MKITIRSILILSGLILPLMSWSQDLEYARRIIKTLCSEEYAGRGYIDEGDKKAAELIRKEFSSAGLSQVGENYYQPFGFNVVIYPGEANAQADEKVLLAGTDFIPGHGCPAIYGTFKVIHIDSVMIDNTSEFKKWSKKNLRNTFLVVDAIKGIKSLHPERIEQVLNNSVKARGLIFEKNDNLVWGVALNFAPFPTLYFKTGSLPSFVNKLKINLEASRIPHGTQNVVAMIPGTVRKDSFILVTAHYDHLGMLGKYVYFPGANDNASGVAMMLDMARYYSKNKPAYSIIFIAFAAEEAGLLGSYYFTENPLVNLKRISLMVNLDLMSTGDEGLTAVNGLIYPELFNSLVNCNNIGNYLPDIAARGKAQNSDHYYFSELGVPALFFYLRGNYHHYHDVDDTYQALTLSKYPEAFKLIRDFINERMAKQ